jgi:hypothetical protein
MLIRKIQADVAEKFSVQLVPEVRIVGDEGVAEHVFTSKTVGEI